jgi:hypothetical protein
MSTRAKIRDDFIRRLFAVAVSVGFAATLIKMKWVENGTFPAEQEWEQLAILATGLIATVLSWDGYLASIADKPLNGYGRFVIDILLVFIYMFFLISSQRANFWLPILAIIFGLYVIWDMFTVREHMRSYDLSLLPAGSDDGYRARVSDVARVYIRGFLNKRSTNRGPIITLSWAVFFAVLAALNLMTARYQVFVTCSFAVAGLILYRRDKSAARGTESVTGHSMMCRAILIGALLGFAALYFCRFQIDRS